VSDFLKEHWVVLRQYFLSDDESIKQNILASAPAFLVKHILIVQDGFDMNIDAKTIASNIQATGFVQEIEQIRSVYDAKFNEIKNLEFEKELASAIKLSERESIKKKLITFEETINEDLPVSELKAAITQVERESLKEKLRQLENVKTGKVIPIRSIITYAAAASFVLAVGIWFYTSTRQDSVNKNPIATASDKEHDIVKKDLVPNLNNVVLAEVSIDSSSSTVLTNGMGFGEVTTTITFIERNQQKRVLSLRKAIEVYQKLLDKEVGPSEPGTEKNRIELQNRISSMQKELSVLNKKEHQYIFNGKQLSLFTSVQFKEKNIILYNDTYYLKINNAFFQLKVSSNPQPLNMETNSDILKALDKIMYNAK